MRNTSTGLESLQPRKIEKLGNLETWNLCMLEKFEIYTSEDEKKFNQNTWNLCASQKRGMNLLESGNCASWER